MRRGLVVLLGFALIAVALSLQSAPSPVAFTTAERTRPLIAGAHLTRPLIFDAGALRLDPLDGKPGMSEQRALALWESQPLGCCQIAANATVFFARATMRILPRTQPNGYAAPRFVNRPSWVFIWDGGSRHCGIDLGGGGPAAVTGPENTPVEIIGADSSGQGVLYNTRGTLCGEPLHGPTAQAASYGLSAPWRIINVTPRPCQSPHTGGPCGSPYKNGNLSVSMPRCARISGGSSGGGRNSPATLEVFVEVPLTGPCTGTKQVSEETPVYGSPIAPKTGLTFGFRSDLGRNVLVYFDGASHTLRF